MSDMAANLQTIEHARMKALDPSTPDLRMIGELEMQHPMRARYFLPPYEHYNQDIALWALDMGLTLINFTPGTRSNADYTGEADTNFVSSQDIFDSIVKKEREDPHGLNGFILLLHLGSGPGRQDKFHYRFGELLDYLAGKGYEFVRVDELLEPKLEVTK
jgi:peptidoglycan/xylan/chitin deacetylase (PgdA/CDA1 family)